jgi:hypothetical protein
VIGGARRGHVGDEALAVGVIQIEGFVGDRHRFDERVPEGLVAGACPAHHGACSHCAWLTLVAGGRVTPSLGAYPGR